MTDKEAKRVKIGDKVVFSDGIKGECIEVGFNACKFSWEDGQVGIIHHNDMQEVARA